MDKIVIEGGRPLEGEIAVSGAKNAALPLIFSALLSDEPLHLLGVPDVADIRTACRLLERLGARIERPDPSELVIDCSAIESYEAPYELVRTMRASFLVLGPLLARFGRARVSQPGGCAIGTRPIDEHLLAMRRLGARIEREGGYVDARADRLAGGHCILGLPSVGATENAMMAAVLARGVTRIENAAREPEIVDLAQCLNARGARIDGAGHSVIEIEGVERLSGGEHRVIPDRIEAGTYLIAGLITGGRVRARGARSEHLGALLEKLEEAGASLEVDGEAVTASATGRPRATDVTTAPFPGFPTDLQAQFMALMAIADGTSVITETIFENRFMHVPELMRMGADVRLSGRRAVVRGQDRLTGAPVMATDLRASVSLVLAGLAARSRTEVLRVYHLDRGYERIEEKLSALGAQIARVPDETGAGAAR
ncbi:MAG: UDP-N-acetylglucosamine 1-carboxyvinyltransferase [Candidatus Dadabacteria bacterium]|nr:MAG: UDP-N-acetylglucosamine 1-carboxyvinyltransferase [Candidatus Dadabacteria bacterium]